MIEVLELFILVPLKVPEIYICTASSLRDGSGCPQHRTTGYPLFCNARSALIVLHRLVEGFAVNEFINIGVQDANTVTTNTCIYGTTSPYMVQKGKNEILSDD